MNCDTEPENASHAALPYAKRGVMPRLLVVHYTVHLQAGRLLPDWIFENGTNLVACNRPAKARDASNCILQDVRHNRSRYLLRPYVPMPRMRQKKVMKLATDWNG